MLCDVCKYVLLELLRRQRQEEFIESPFVLRDEIDIPESTMSKAERLKRCFVCQNFQDVIENLACGMQDRWEGPQRQLRVTPRDMNNEHYVRFLVHALDRDLYDIAKGSLLTASTGSDESLLLASHWLRDCLRNHPECKSRRGEQWYPPRLLDVGATNVRLVQTAEHKPTGPYVTMSHCWGEKKLFVLTQENKGRLETGIPLSVLGRNFRDTIYVVKQLGFRYIWIDCFCIVQESAIVDIAYEKMLEIAQMKDIYTNVILNIGVTHGGAPDFGCFVDRSMVGSFIDYFSADPAQCVGATEHFCIYSESKVAEASLLASNTLFGRAWVFQERLLCPRMLHFGSRQLHWECNSLTEASELFPYSGRYAKEGGPFSINESLLLKRPLDFWTPVVQQYRKMKLSYAIEDKLVAIGAFAERTAEITGTRYIAGLLEKDIITQLDWVPSRHSQRAISWRAPSWSWAALDEDFQDLSHVKFKWTPRRTPYVGMANVTRVEVKLQNPGNEFGSMRSASIVVEGRALEVDAPANEARNSAASGVAWTCRLREPNGFDLNVHIDAQSTWPAWGSATIPGASVEMLEKLKQHTSDLYIIPLYMTYEYPNRIITPADALAQPRRFCSFIDIHGIFVQKIGPNAYVRRGCINVDISDIPGYQNEALLKSWSTTKTEVFTLL